MVAMYVPLVVVSMVVNIAIAAVEFAAVVVALVVVAVDEVVVAEETVAVLEIADDAAIAVKPAVKAVDIVAYRVADVAYQQSIFDNCTSLTDADILCGRKWHAHRRL